MGRVEKTIDGREKWQSPVEDKSLIIHAKRGFRHVGQLGEGRLGGLAGSTCVRTYLLCTYRERDKSRGVRWTMVIS